jgi:hypothetical protein
MGVRDGIESSTRGFSGVREDDSAEPSDSESSLRDVARRYVSRCARSGWTRRRWKPGSRHYAELNALANRIDSMPAGAGVLEMVGIVFIVLLILEAVGVLDIFQEVPSAGLRARISTFT